MLQDLRFPFLLGDQNFLIGVCYWLKIDILIIRDILRVLSILIEVCAKLFPSLIFLKPMKM